MTRIPLTFSALLVVGLANVLVLCAEEKQADKEYLDQLSDQIVGKDGIPDPDETEFKVDITRVQNIAKSNKDLRSEACRVLSAVKEPSQLDFLISIVSKPENRAFFSGPSGIAHNMAAQVRSEADIEKLKSLLNDDALVPDLLLAVRRTTNDEIVKKALNPMYAENTKTAFDVTEFITYRLDNNLQIRSKEELETFLKKSCRHKGWTDSSSWRSADIAARLRFEWVAEWFINAINSLGADKRFPEQSNLYSINEIIVSLSEATGKSFGQKRIPRQNFKADEQTKKEIAAAVEKCTEWWKTASKDPKYRLNPDSSETKQEQKK